MGKRFLAVLLTGITATAPLTLHAQAWPAKVVRIVTTPPGSGNDLVARILAQDLSKALGQQIIVDNRGLIAAEVVAKSAPDGYTFLSYGSPVWISPLMRSVAWDINRDFTPVTVTVSTPNVLVVHPSMPVKTVADLVALGRARPGELNYGAASTGSTSHLAGELFVRMAKIKAVRIAYKGTGPALTGLMGGEVHLMFPNAATASSSARAGKLRLLAVTSLRPSALAPGIPTLAASFPGYESESPFALFAPAGTPPAVINRLNKEIARILHQPAIAERLLSAGMEVVASSPEQLAAIVNGEIARWGPLIRDLGLREN